MGKKIAAAAALALTAALAVTTTPVHESPAAAATSTGSDLRVASFNIQSVSVDRTEGARLPWKKRRGTVIRQILGEQVDVIGVQEAHPSRYFAPRLVDGPTQFLDLRNGLNKAGGHYQLTNRYSFNCVNPRTGYKCVRQYRGASYSDRILFNTDTIELVSQGSMGYAKQVDRNRPRYLAWAVLRVKATGTEFLFTTTHLEGDAREAQWQQLIQKINALKGSMPVIATGDFNTEKFDPLCKTVLPAMKQAGYGDVLNQKYAENPVTNPRVNDPEHDLVNAWINSANHDSKDVASYAYENRHDKVGNDIDWIFATNSLPVLQFKVVLRFDPSTLQVQGVLPSDHNMIEATLRLP